MARFQIIHEVSDDDTPDEWHLCFQYGRYYLDDGRMEQGYRFIWRRADGSLQAARGQARLPSIKAIEFLLNKAIQEGWGTYEDE